MGGNQGVPLWAILLVSNIVSWAGLGWGAYQQYLDRLALRDLQLRAELAGLPSTTWSPTSWQRSGAGPEEPSPGKLDLGLDFQQPGQSPKVAPLQKEESWVVEHRLAIGLGASLVGLLLVLVTDFAAYRVSSGGLGEAELGLSPTERHRRLAQRQLAELRLRRHGFGR